jgi:hypothetical protein
LWLLSSSQTTYKRINTVLTTSLMFFSLWVHVHSRTNRERKSSALFLMPELSAVWVMVGLLLLNCCQTLMSCNAYIPVVWWWSLTWDRRDHSTVGNVVVINEDGFTCCLNDTVHGQSERRLACTSTTNYTNLHKVTRTCNDKLINV